jgi:pilus assembly protein CpaF
MPLVESAAEQFLNPAPQKPEPAPAPKPVAIEPIPVEPIVIEPLEPEEKKPALEEIASQLARISEMLQEHWHVAEPKDDGESSESLEHLLAASPIAALLKDDAINDILINGPNEIYVTRADMMEKTSIRFPDRRSLRTLANAIAESVGRSIEPTRPLVDARLKDGSRVNIIAPPMAVNGLTMSIRKFARRDITLAKLVEKGEMTAQMARFFELCAQGRVSMLISGGTGTGKTTLLNAISHYIPESERIITIEDTAELRLQQAHVVQLEIKEPRIIGARQEEVNASDLVRNALRMRPDRIIIGEIRGDEAFDMIQAMNTGHDGSIATIHATAPRDAFARMENLISPRMPNMPIASVRSQITSALNIIVQLVYHSDGKRFVSSITEVVGMEGDIPTMQELFSLKASGPGPAGLANPQQVWANIMPRHPRLAEMVRQDPIFMR